MIVFPSIEPLETRIAPAGVFFTFGDVDGDLIKVSSSKGTLHDLFTGATVGGNGLTTLDLSHNTWGNEFNGANISVTVIMRATAGDGVINTGYINAGGINLGTVTIQGDLGKITVGAQSTTVPAVKSMAVHSLGEQGTTTGAPDLVDTFDGPVGVLAVTGNVNQAELIFSNKVGAIKIGGNLIGGSASNSGEITDSGNGGPFGSISIGGSVIGGSGTDSAAIQLGGSIGSIRIGGSLFGGTGPSSAAIGAENTGSISIGGNIIGNAEFSADVSISGRLGSFTVGGSVTGGSGDYSTLIQGDGIGSAKIGGSFTGGAGYLSGVIEVTDASATFGSIVIGGDLAASGGEGSGQILGGGSLGTVKIGGSVIGSNGPDAGGISAFKIGSILIAGDIDGYSSSHPVQILAIGQPSPANATQAMVLGSLTVDGSVSNAQVIAGDFEYQEVQVGTVKVMGNWTASSLVVGAQNLGTDGMTGGTGTAADNVNFGDSYDSTILGGGIGGPTILAKIDNVAIGGQIDGTAGGTDHFGFVAQQIVAFSAGGHAVALTSGADNDDLVIGDTGDVNIHEV